ncbi:MAG: hypothetical protein R3E12_02160 [Candidatus Eisenbacteria bacterium]
MSRINDERTSFSPEDAERFLHRLDLAAEAERGGVHVAQQFVDDREVLLRDALEILEVEIGLLDLLQHAQVVDLARRDIPSLHHDGAAEEVALEEAAA